MKTIYENNSIIIRTIIFMTVLSVKLIASSAEEMSEAEENPKQQKGAETSKYSEEEIGRQGNWRKKKDWLKQAQEKNDSIQNILADTQQYRTIFSTKFSDIDNLIDQFYRNSSFKKGKLDTLFEEIKKEIEEKKELTQKLFSTSLSELDETTKEGAIAIKNQFVSVYDISEEFKKRKQKLTQLQLDIKSISELDASVHERLKKVDAEIAKITSKAKESYDLSKKIWYVINDKKAKDIFYTLDNIYKHIDSLQTYIKKDLSANFDSVINTIKTQIQKTKDTIQEIEKNGVLVVDRTNRISIAQKKLENQIKKNNEKKKHVKKRSTQNKNKPSWLSLIAEGVLEFASNIKLVFVSLYEIITGK